MEKDTIKKLLKDNNITQTELAKYLGITPSMIGQWIRGERPISVLIAIKIEKEYGVDAGILNSDVKLSRESIPRSKG